MSEEVLAAEGTLDYWRRRAEQAEQERDNLSAFMTALSDLDGCGCQFCQVVDRADELLPALAQARAEVVALNDSCQAWIESEARWRQRAEQAEATAAALRSAILAYTTSATIDDRARLAGELYDLASASDAGATLLAELAAARAALEMAIYVRPELVNDFQAGPLIHKALTGKE